MTAARWMHDQSTCSFKLGQMRSEVPLTQQLSMWWYMCDHVSCDCEQASDRMGSYLLLDLYFTSTLYKSSQAKPNMDMDKPQK